MKEEKEKSSPRIFLYRKAECLFVEGGLRLECIPAFLRSKISALVLLEWHAKGDWDCKRKKYLDLKLSLLDDAKQLASMALAIAKCKPTSVNISTFKRAVEALTAIEKITPDEEEEVCNNELTPEKLDEFAKKAVLR